MGMTMAEKILASHSGQKKVTAGEYVTAKVDQVLIHDSFIDIEEDMHAAGIPGGLSRVWDKDRVVIIIEEGEELEIILGADRVSFKNLTRGGELSALPIPDTMAKVLEAGGVYPLLKQRLAEEA